MEGTKIMEDFVPRDIAVLLKEKGYDWDCRQVYDLMTKETNTRVYFNFEDRNPNRCKDLCSAPSLAEAMKWLRRKYGVYIDVTTRISGNVDKDVCCTYHITWVQNWQVMHMYDGEYCYWEEAAKFGLHKALTSVLPSLIKTSTTNESLQTHP